MTSKLEPLVDAVIVSSLNASAECIQVYDTATGTLLKSYRGIPAAPSTMCLIGLGAYLITAQKDKPFLQVWAIHRNEALQIRLVVPGKVNAMAVSPTGPKYCVIGVSEKMYIYKLLSGRLIGVVSRHYQPITRLVFTPCGNYFASGGEDGFVYLWRLASFHDALHTCDSSQVQPHFIFGQHTGKVTDLAMTSLGMRGFLVSSSSDRTARVFDLITGRTMYTLVTTGSVTSVACNGLGSQVFLGHRNGTVNIVNLLPAPSVGDVQVSSKGVTCHEKSVQCLAVTVSGNHLITGGDDGEVKIWSVVNRVLGIRRNTMSHDPNLALQRIVHTGYGPITNLTVLHIEREVLTATEIDIKEVIAPLSQDHSSPLSALVTAPIRGRGKQDPEQLELLNFTPELSVVQSSEESPKHESDITSNIAQLKAANSQLFQVAVRHIIGEKQ